MLLWTFFGHFEKLIVFPVFWSFSKFRLSTVHWEICFGKIHLKTSSKLVWTLLGQFLDTFEFSNFFRYFFRIFPSFDPRGCTSQIFFTEKTTSKHVQNVFELFGDRFWAFGKKMEIFPFFWRFSMFRPSRVHWAIFFPQKYLKTSSTLVWKLLRTFLDTFRNSIFFDFFRISTSFDLQVALVKKSSEKITSKRIWTLLETFFGTSKIWIFFLFLKFFDFSTLQGALVNFFYQKKLPRRMLKTCLNTFGKDFGHFEKKNKVFQFFLSFSKFRPSRVHWALFFRGKTSKQVQNLFGHFWKRVWVSWILRSFCISLKFFDVSTLQGALAKKSRKNHIKTCLDNLGNVFGHFWKFEVFSILVDFFESPGFTGWSFFPSK